MDADAWTAMRPMPLPPDVRAERGRRLRALVARKATVFRAGLRGHVVDVVVLHRRERGGDRLEALTDNYVRAFLDGPEGWMGRRLPVRLGAPHGPGLLAATGHQPSAISSCGEGAGCRGLGVGCSPAAPGP